METDDYELIPLNPIRRLEKRIERIENVKDKEIFDELLQTIKINQETVDQLTKMNTDLVKEITTLSGSIENLSSKLSDFLERVEVESLEAPDEEYEKIKEENKKFAEKEEKLTEKVQMLEKKLMPFFYRASPRKEWRKECSGLADQGHQDQLVLLARRDQMYPCLLQDQNQEKR